MRNTLSRKTALLAILIVAVIGGGMPTFVKISLQSILPLNFIFIRFFISLIFLTPLLLKQRIKFDLKLLKVFLVSLLATANVVLFTFGITSTTAISSQVLYSTVPIFAALLSYLILKSKISSNKILGIVVGFVGTIVIVLLPFFGGSQLFSGNIIGNIAILTAVISFSAYTVLSKRLQETYSPSFLTLMFTLTTVIVMSVLAVIETANNIGWWASVTPAAILGLLYVSLLGTVIYYFLYQYAIKKGTPVIASMVFYLQPLTAYGWAAIILGERITTPFLIGATLVLIGAKIATNSKKEKKDGSVY